MLKEDLIEFEKEVESIYKTGVIRGPIHLRDGNEEHLIEIFRGIKSKDIVYSTWASHLHALLKGIPRDKLLQSIVDGKSITINFPEFNFYSSAIVGGTCPIAVGMADSIKRKGEDRRVFCFLGDMCFHMGACYEAMKYASGLDLPITFIIENNFKSVGSPTEEVWQTSTKEVFDFRYNELDVINKNHFDMIYYEYTLTLPHSGIGQFIAF